MTSLSGKVAWPTVMFATNQHDGVEFFQQIIRTITLKISTTRSTVQKEDPERSHKKTIQEIPLDMGRGNDVGRGVRGRTGGRGASGRALAAVSHKASEQGACKDLEGHIFTIGSGNKGKDGDMLRTSKEKMATYIGTKYGDDTAQEWTSEKRINLPQLAYSKAILDRHAERVKATKDRVKLKLSSLQ